MEKINIKQVAAGSTLAADVTGDSGHVLLRAGTKLSARHINLLQSRGVTMVHIGATTAPTHTGINLASDAIDSIIKARFRKVDTRQVLIAALMELCRTRLQ